MAPHARFLEPKDIPALLDLERSKWESHQAASADALRQRISTHPELCVGAFCSASGKALASLFLRPANAAMFTAPIQWKDTANPVARHTAFFSPTRSLFGISLSSVDASAVDAIFEFIYPRLLRGGWRDVYLGSPIPGYRKALVRRPGLSVWEYVHAKRSLRRAEPLDPQLCYYYRKGFRQIVSIQRDYFPHDESLDYGVILRGVIPLAHTTALWRAMPRPVLTGLSKILFRFAY